MCQSEIKFAFVIEFSVAGITLVQTGFHIVSLLEAPVKRTVVARESILGKLMCIDLSSMPGIFFVVHFPNTLERD